MKLQQSAFENEVAGNWGWLLGLGLILITVGIIGLVNVIASSLAAVWAIGVMLFAAGVSQIATGAMTRKWSGFLFHLAIAALYLVAGYIFVSRPLGSVLTLAWLLGLLLIVVGGFRIVQAASLPFLPHRGWLVAGGVFSVVAGGLILAQWPAQAFWVVGTLVSIELIFSGFAYSYAALGGRALVATLQR